MPAPLTDAQRATLRAVCDTVVPSIERTPDPTGHWARKASDLGVDQAFEQMLDDFPPEDRAGMCELLDALGEQQFAAQSQYSREQQLRNIALLGPQAAAGVGALTGLTIFLYYGMPDPQTGRNPNWETFGYPGPLMALPDTPKPLQPLAISGDTTLEADAVVVGSGAGGGVIAGTLAKQGQKVVVLEMGGYYNEADFNQLELPGYQTMYWRAGPTPTADLNVTLLAGSTLGGGTVINWTNSLKTKPHVREQWAREYGLEGVDGPEFDRHLDAIFTRLKVNDSCSDFNKAHQKMREAAEKLGWSFKTILRNTDPATYDPAIAGSMGFGDVTGSKQSTQKTYLLDAAEHGAEFVTQAFATTVLTEGGRASGVEALHASGAKITVHAKTVVVACGALESPALLLRSGIGGPATGDYLRLHPAWAVMGQYGEDMEEWWGAPQSGLIDEFANIEDGNGFLIEGSQYTTGLGASAVPFTTAAAHKEFLEGYKYGAAFVGLIRDRGHGRITIDDNGQAVPWYSVTDELDRRMLHMGVEKCIRTHHAAGAHTIIPWAGGLPMWRSGDNLERFLTRANRIPLRAGGLALFSAHQMGSCRMGADPATSVAGPYGELHDTPGVWIGDASAFPTPSGTNPMISVMALAHRTAEAITGVTDKAPALAGATAK
jgi:choline dehydrogenase-like flavoprotein